MTLPFPNPYSHPMPRFAYDPSTGHIHVRFSCDPSYAPPNSPPSLKWKEREYLVTSIPSAKRNTSLINTATEFIFSSASRFALSVKSPSTPSFPINTNEFGEFDLRDEEVMEEERGEEGDVDDAHEDRRDMRVLSLPHTAILGMAEGGSRKARERRRWEIVPILRERAKSRHSFTA
jgi:DDB1- and CUL4-associated factor 11